VSMDARTLEIIMKAKDHTKAGLDGATSNVNRTLGKLAKVGAVAGAAAVAGITALATAAITNADNLQKMADKTGLTAERLQELQYIGVDLGVELDTIAGAQAKLTKSMDAARKGTKTAADAYKTLGIDVTDSNGQLRDAKTVMLEAFDALGKVGNETERDALAQKLFGKSAQELNPLIKAGAAELERMAQAARDSGAVMSNESVAGLDAFGDAIGQAKQAFMGIFGTVFAKILAGDVEGALNLVKSKIEKMGRAVVTWISKNGSRIAKGLIRWTIAFVEWVGRMTPKIVAGLWQLVQRLFVFIKEAAPGIIAKLGEWARAFVSWILPRIPAMLIALGKFLLAVLKWVVTDALPKLVYELIKLGASILAGLAQGLKNGAVAVWSWLRSLPGKIKGYFANAGNWLWDKGKALVNGLLNGIRDALQGGPPWWLWILNPAMAGAWEAGKAILGKGSSVPSGGLPPGNTRSPAISQTGGTGHQAVQALTNQAMAGSRSFTRSPLASGGGGWTVAMATATPLTVPVAVYLDGREVGRGVATTMIRNRQSGAS
jgi:hypothetical protein